MVEDNEVEEAVRRSLERHAGATDTAAPVAERARGAVRKRRATRLTIGTAAAAVLAVAVTGALLSRGGDSDPGPADRGDDSLPTKWRTEYWRDLKVEVPADWGYGGAPHVSGGTLLACWPSAMVDPDGNRLEDDPTRGYVGRPIGLTDLCATYPDNRPEEPQAPYVWLGAEIDTGTVELGNGFVQETVEVNGSTLTVATDNAALRKRILDSAGGGEQCFSELERPPTSDLAADLGGPARGMAVCAYGRDESGVIGLTYAGVVSDEAAAAFVAAFSRGVPIPVGRACDLGSDDSWVVLATGNELYVVSPQGLGCPQVAGPDTPAVLPRRLSRAMARPWAVGGIPAVVHASPGPEEPWMYRYFIGPQG
jgi:hypothetical protein